MTLTMTKNTAMTPTIHHHIASIREALHPKRSQHRIALVPTMGNLHDGHLQLVKLARQHADIVIVSIFVNPTQFGVGEDFDSYPRTLAEDVTKLSGIGVDYVFAPTSEQMYPVLPPPTAIRAGAITAQLCGKTRPTHFDGVGIVVAKLFNIIQPDVAVFGQKDYQQLAIIQQLVRDLSYPIKIIGAPIVRASDGLALSSRNQYLTDDERKIAPLLRQELQLLAQQLVTAELTLQAIEALLSKTHARLSDLGFIVDYLDIKAQDLTDIDDSQRDATLQQERVILAAAWLGRARLLDNLVVTVH